MRLFLDEEEMYDGDIQNEENLVIDTNQEQELDCEQDKYQEEKLEKQELEKEEEIPSQFYITDEQQQQEQLQQDSANYEGDNSKPKIRYGTNYKFFKKLSLFHL